MSGRHWTATDVAQLINLHSNDIPVTDIAAKLSRTPGATWAKLLALDGRKDRTKGAGPLGETYEDRHFANDARIGSAMLLEAIERARVAA